MSVRAIFLGPQYEYRRNKIERDSISSDCNRGDLSPDRHLDTVSNGPTNAGEVCLGHCIWSASRPLHNCGLHPNEIRPSPCIFVLPKNAHFAL